MSAIRPQFTTLSYPLYACDFDPSDANRLMVAGGGGVSRAGVPNQISLLNASNPDSPLQVASEIELSKHEDNVTSLAVGQRKGRSTLVYAGVNSGPEDQKKGINTHFRVFSFDVPSKTKANVPPKINLLSKTHLFSAKDVDTYQRLLRLSEPFEGLPQVGACATGLSKEPQIVLFDVSATGNTGPKTRGRLELTKDAVDLDIIQTDADSYMLAYCDEYDLSIMTIAKGSTEGPRVVYTLTADEAIGSKTRPEFRFIRFLTPTFLLAVANLPKNGGAVLAGIRLLNGTGRLSISARLPKALTKANGLAVRNLSPVAAPTAKQGEAQFVVAVAGSDRSIALYTLEHQSASGLEAIVRLHPFHTLKAVHDFNITGVAFSHYHPPAKPSTRTQYLKLASVSVSNTVVVHHIPLRKVSDKSALARRGGPPRQPRYVVALKSKGPSPTSLFVTIAIVVVLLAAALQSVLEIKGLTTPVIGARRFTPASWHAPPGAVRPGGPLAAFLADDAHRGAYNKLVLREADADASAHGIEVAHHDEEVHGEAVPWQELPPEQRAKWRARLEKAGKWSGEMGDTIFKGILFSEIAGAVGGLVGG